MTFEVALRICVAIIAGVMPAVLLLGLLAIGIVMLHRYAGPYNGGSDRMTLLMLTCVAAAYWMPTPAAKELALGYLSMQLILSYVISGWVKLRNPEWREGRALADVFRFSAYPVSEALRTHADRGTVLFAASWGVILFEVLFPLTLISPIMLGSGLFVAAGFHFANACLFGLNRFFWIWLAAYPSLFWFQDRIFG